MFFSKNKVSLTKYGFDFICQVGGGGLPPRPPPLAPEPLIAGAGVLPPSLRTPAQGRPGWGPGRGGKGRTLQPHSRPRAQARIRTPRGGATWAGGPLQPVPAGSNQPLGAPPKPAHSPSRSPLRTVPASRQAAVRHRPRHRARRRARQVRSDAGQQGSEGLASGARPPPVLIGRRYETMRSDWLVFRTPPPQRPGLRLPTHSASAPPHRPCPP